jgi:hypothetical protein
MLLKILAIWETHHRIFWGHFIIYHTFLHNRTRISRDKPLYICHYVHLNMYTNKYALILLSYVRTWWLHCAESRISHDPLKVLVSPLCQVSSKQGSSKPLALPPPHIPAWYRYLLLPLRNKCCTLLAPLLLPAWPSLRRRSLQPLCTHCCTPAHGVKRRMGGHPDGLNFGWVHARDVHYRCILAANTRTK